MLSSGWKCAAERSVQTMFPCKVGNEFVLGKYFFKILCQLVVWFCGGDQIQGAEGRSLYLYCDKTGEGRKYPKFGCFVT